jgi:kynurenine formamidase/D-alanyl-D-alanine dipeptidase
MRPRPFVVLVASAAVLCVAAASDAPLHAAKAGAAPPAGNAPAAPPAATATASPTAGAPPVEAGPFRAPDLVELTALDPSIRLDIRYARTDNFLGRAVYTEARAFLQRPAAEALARVHRALAPDGYGLMVFDGYRPWAVTKLFWDATPADKKVYVADPAKGSRHNRGCAVDLTLFDLRTGREVPMPSAYDDSTERAHATYAGGTDEERKARQRLIDAMTQAGFFVYPYEWWHYDWKDWRSYPILDIPFSAIEKRAPAAAPDLSTARRVDLSWPFDASTLYWPTSPTGFTLESLHHGPTPGGYFYAANTFRAPEHGGTHLDAPIHFAEGGHTADEIPLEQLMAPAVVIDVATRAAADRDYRLAPADVAAWEKVHGRIPKGVIVLLRTGWGARWPDRGRYFGSDKPGDASGLHFPSYGAEAARLLVGERGVAAIGVDTASIDYGPSQDFIVHQVVLGANVPAFENVAHLDQVPETGAWVAALPMKIAGGSGGPLRIVAFVPAGDGKESP